MKLRIEIVVRTNRFIVAFAIFLVSFGRVEEEKRRVNANLKMNTRKAGKKICLNSVLQESWRKKIYFSFFT